MALRSRLTLPGAHPAASMPRPPPPRPVPKPPEPRPAAKAETPPEPDLPRGVAAFAHLSALVPPGEWPVTLPTTAGRPVRPLALGMRERLEALLPPEHHKTLRQALRRYCGSRAYREALVAEGAMRWSDAGEPLEPVADEHRAYALRRLEAMYGPRAGEGGGS